MPTPGLKSHEMKTRLRPGKSKSHKSSRWAKSCLELTKTPGESGSNQASTRPSTVPPEGRKLIRSALEEVRKHYIWPRHENKKNQIGMDTSDEGYPYRLHPDEQTDWYGYLWWVVSIPLAADKQNHWYPYLCWEVSIPSQNSDFLNLLFGLSTYGNSSFLGFFRIFWEREIERI
jgi:hypothetical protein